MGGELARYVTELLICVWLIAPSKIHNVLIFDQFVLKLSLTCFSNFSASIKTKLISGWTFTLMVPFYGPDRDSMREYLLCKIKSCWSYKLWLRILRGWNFIWLNTTWLRSSKVLWFVITFGRWPRYGHHKWRNGVGNLWFIVKTRFALMCRPILR